MPSLCQYRAPPHEIMVVVLRALQELTVRWKKIGDYSMKCRWIPGTLEPHKGKAMAVNDHPVHNSELLAQPSIVEKDAVMNPPNVVKFEVQVMHSSCLFLLLNAYERGEIQEGKGSKSW